MVCFQILLQLIGVDFLCSYNDCFCLIGELFNIEYDLLLYDVICTFFEGQCLGNPLAKPGYSRDQRSDCKQFCIGLVVTRCGMPLGYEVFAGNIADVTTVKGDRRDNGKAIRQIGSHLGNGSWHDLSRQPGIF